MGPVDDQGFAVRKTLADVEIAAVTDSSARLPELLYNFFWTLPG